MAGIYNGYILEFPQIRIDCFTSPPRPLTHFTVPHPFDPSAIASSEVTKYPAPPARLFLLSHVHSDHLLGLSDDFTGKIVCSPDTKRMLVRLEAEKCRGFLIGGTKETITRKYAGLKPRRVGEGRSARVIDMIEALPIGHPKEYDLGTDMEGKAIRVTITLLDANHCPGSAMFLITSVDRAVLHTGDIRCDKLFMQSLKRNPALQQYMCPASPIVPKVTKLEGGQRKGVGRCGSGRRILDRIYLDTSAFLGTGDMPDREEALQDLLDQMSLYPEETIFFINVWCFGWEDVIKEVARHFDSPVHVDRYKRSIFSAVHTDPFLSACTTLDASLTRFHACERQAKCDRCRTFDKDGVRKWNLGERIVHVTMAEIKSASWAMERKEFVRKLNAAAEAEAAGKGKGNWPYNILCPIARHSPLPELQDLVRLFRPHAISPNTLVPQFNGLDYFLLPDFLSDVVQPGAYNRMVLERDAFFADKFGLARLAQFTALTAHREELEAVLRASTGSSERDEYLPDPLGGAMGSSRAAQTRDQLLRVGGIGAGALLKLQGGGAGYGFASRGEMLGEGNLDGYDTDTDDEDRRGRQRKRRRWDDNYASLYDGPDLVIKMDSKLEPMKGVVISQSVEASSTISPYQSAKSPIALQFPRPENKSDLAVLLPRPPPLAIKLERDADAIAVTPKPKSPLPTAEMIIPPYRSSSRVKLPTPSSRRSPSVKYTRNTPTRPASNVMAVVPEKSPSPPSRSAPLVTATIDDAPNAPLSALAAKEKRSPSKEAPTAMRPSPKVELEWQSATSGNKPASSTRAPRKIFTDHARMQRLHEAMLAAKRRGG